MKEIQEAQELQLFITHADRGNGEEVRLIGLMSAKLRGVGQRLIALHEPLDCGDALNPQTGEPLFVHEEVGGVFFSRPDCASRKPIVVRLTRMPISLLEPMIPGGKSWCFRRGNIPEYFGNPSEHDPASCIQFMRPSDLLHYMIDAVSMAALLKVLQHIKVVDSND